MHLLFQLTMANPVRIASYHDDAPSSSPRGVSRETVQRLDKISVLLDKNYVDPVLGFLLPGVGDIVGVVFGMSIVYAAVKARLHPVIVARMLLNLGLDMLIGLVPFVGDIFDVAFKANRKNMELLKKKQLMPKPGVGDWLIVGGAIAVFCAGVVGILLLTIKLFQAIF